MTAPIDTSPEAVERVYLIRKHGAWYRKDSAGYTGSAIQAGRYTLAEAESITHPNGKDGPRDGMIYVHEDAVRCDDLAAYRALRAALTAAEAKSRGSALTEFSALGQAAEAYEAQLRAEAENARLREFLADFAAAKIEALRYDRGRSSPEDDPDPVVYAEEVWNWQHEAAALTKGGA